MLLSRGYYRSGRRALSSGFSSRRKLKSADRIGQRVVHCAAGRVGRMECTQGFDFIVKGHAADGRVVQGAGRSSSVALTQEAHCASQLLHKQSAAVSAASKSSRRGSPTLCRSCRRCSPCRKCRQLNDHHAPHC